MQKETIKRSNPGNAFEEMSLPCRRADQLKPGSPGGRRDESIRLFRLTWNMHTTPLDSAPLLLLLGLETTNLRTKQGQYFL